MTTHISRSQRGFSLIELAIVLTIIGLLLGGSLALFMPMIESSRERLTRQRMDIVTDALVAHFAAEYGRQLLRPGGNGNPPPRHTVLLPCPANPTAGTGIADSTLCAQRGILPWVTLGLQPELANDGWGRRFSYEIRWSTGPSAVNHLVVNQYPQPTGGTITPIFPANQGPEFILVSHGRNGHGAFESLSGAVITIASPTTPEAENRSDNRTWAVAPRSVQAGSVFDDASIWRTWDHMLSRGGMIVTQNGQCPGSGMPPCGGPNQSGTNPGGGNSNPNPPLLRTASASARPPRRPRGALRDGARIG